MTGKDIEDAKNKFESECDEAIKTLYSALDELFETMGQISPMFSNDYKDIMSQVLKSLKPWETAVCKNIDRAVNPKE